MALSYKITNLIEELQGACHYDNKHLFCCVIDKNDGTEVDAAAADIDALEVMLMVLIKGIAEAKGETPKQVVRHSMRVAKKCDFFNKNTEMQDE